MSDIESELAKLAAKAGSKLGPLEFYHCVQLAYHDVESEGYDQIHAEMFVSLENIFSRLFSQVAKRPGMLTILDIGAGTGLVETFLFRRYTRQIELIDVVDPNAKMIMKLVDKNREWKLPIRFSNGYLEDVFLLEQYDAVICSSVLHHIPNLSAFFSRCAKLIKPGGYFLSMQDPRAEAGRDETAVERQRQCQSDSESGGMAAKRHIRAVMRRFGFGNFTLKRNPLEIAVNRELQRREITSRALSISEIWAITDIHVPGQPGGMGVGISRTQLHEWLGGFTEADYLSYNFFKRDLLSLNEKHRRLEAQMLEANDPHGFLFASLFRKNS